jgi:hypothetical protein
MRPKTASKDSAFTIYYNYDGGIPAKMEPGKFPVTVLNGRETVVYKLQKFFENARRITLKEFQDLVKRQ